MEIYNRAVVDPSRTMARVVRIVSITKNPKSDFLYIVKFAKADGTVYAWQCVTRVQYNVVDLCIYIEIDSVLHPDFVFAQELYKTNITRIKTIKLRDALSQGMLLPLDVLPVEHQNAVVDTDVTTALQIRKYVSASEAAEYADDNCEGKKPFPSDSISKTEEHRLQNMTEVIPELATRQIVITQKEDGTSGTFTTEVVTAVAEDGTVSENVEFVVCSRNIRWDRNVDAGKLYWKMFDQYNIAAFLRDHPDLAIQGEIVGPGINGNKLKLKTTELHVFNIQRKNLRTYLSHAEVNALCKAYGLTQVKELFVGCGDDLIAFVNNTAKTTFTEVSDQMFIALTSALKYPGNTPVEGIVIKTEDDGERISVKVISPEFLLKQKD